MIHIREADKCTYGNCDRPAENIVAHRVADDKVVVMALCRQHTYEIEDQIELESEYTVACPNCSCVFGVN